MNRISLILLANAFAAFPLSANDTVAEIGAGGLEYVRTDQIEMVREDLFISLEEVRVDYVFRNHGEEDITAMVAFPMPDIEADVYSDTAIPFQNDDNFLGFTVSVDGRPIDPKLQQRASVIGVDVTRELVKRHIPLLPTQDAATDTLNSLGSETLAFLEQRGLIKFDVYNAGEGDVEDAVPQWTLRSTYYWEMTFPAGEEVRVSHSYTPAIGATTGMASFFYDSSVEISDDYANRYCVDEAFTRATSFRVQNGEVMFESWISYILKTGGNWFRNIGTFHLTVDKGSTSNLVSFCGEGVTKTGPTTFELTYENFFPQQDLDILILRPIDDL